MTKIFVEVLEPAEDGKGMRIKSSEEITETVKIDKARKRKNEIVLEANQTKRIHICKHGDGEGGNNLPCEIET